MFFFLFKFIYFCNYKNFIGRHNLNDECNSEVKDIKAGHKISVIFNFLFNFQCKENIFKIIMLFMNNKF